MSIKPILRDDYSTVPPSDTKPLSQHLKARWRRGPEWHKVKNYFDVTCLRWKLTSVYGGLMKKILHKWKYIIEILIEMYQTLVQLKHTLINGRWIVLYETDDTFGGRAKRLAFCNLLSFNPRKEQIFLPVWVTETDLCLSTGPVMQE